DQLWSPWRLKDRRGEQPRPVPAPDCIFCDKVKADDDADAHIQHRGETCFITLNLYPYNNGHLMIVPYQHTGDLTALSRPTLDELIFLTQRSVELLTRAYHPEGFNISINQGRAAGAGIAEHLHQHIVPRRLGDTDFITTIGEARVVPEQADDTDRDLTRPGDAL